MNGQKFSTAVIGGIAVCALIFFLPCTVFGQNYRIQAVPQVLIPVQGDQEIFGVGYGASANFEREITTFMAPWLNLRFQNIPPASSDMNGALLLVTAGTGLEFFTFPLPRLKIGAEAGAGIYAGSYRNGSESTPTGNLYWQAGVNAGYRVSPELTFSAGASYIDLMRQSDSLFRGLAISLSADFGFRARTTEGRAILDNADILPVYPILSGDYRDKSFGTIRIRNAENAEIRNVRVWFDAGEYSSGPELCGTVDYLRRNGQADFPLLASFSDQVMSVTEEMRTTGEIHIEYELLGVPRTSDSETTITFHDRNSLTWEDPEILAAFISPNDQALLDLSKHVAGLVRSETRSEVDSNLQYALALFEGLRLSGIAWSEDPQTPYRMMRSSADKIDYIQYPHQTIAYRGGDSDDLAVLYAAAVESVGVPAAFIPLEDEVLVAIKLNSKINDVMGFFANPDRFMISDEDVWLPVRVSMLREGFLRAWSEGARLAGENSEVRDLFFPVQEAWNHFPPAGVPDIRISSRKPDENQVVRAFNKIVSLVVEREVNPKAEKRRESFGPDGGTGRQLNSLGVLYARYGVYRKALEEFQAAANAGYRKAHINIGNVAFLLGEYETALAWFEKVSAEYPDNPAAVIGLARTYYELDRYDEADRYFALAKNIQPDLSERYSYLSARITDSVARASAAMERLGDMLWDE